MPTFSGVMKKFSKIVHVTNVMKAAKRFCTSMKTINEGLETSGLRDRLQISLLILTH